MNEMPAPIPEVPCLCHAVGPTDHGPGCMCGISERVIRHIMRGEAKFTPEQREWALKEIDCVEGCTRKDYETESDADVAVGVLHAWVDYARDKGNL